MDIKNTIVKIINLPSEFYALGNVSIFSLLKETGYFEVYEQISEEDFLKELNQNPSVANQWLDWSDNKRVNSGWFFKLNDNQKYVVGYFPVNGNSKPKTYSDIEAACAYFIKVEIEDIRKS